MSQPRSAPWLFWAQGFCLAPGWIFLRPERMGDAALLAHEKVHVEQMLRYGWAVFWINYLFDREFRLEAELQAYRVQLRMRPDQLYLFAGALADRYWLNVTVDEAVALLLDT